MLSSSGSSVDEDESQDFSGDSNPQMFVWFNQEVLNGLIFSEYLQIS